MCNFDLDEFIKTDDIINLNKIIYETNEKMEGNILYRHHSNFELHLKNKEAARSNLYCLSNMSAEILEIGFNGGHSGALYFYANPKLRLVAFDLCVHKYAELCFNYLNTKYNIELIKGDSLKMIPRHNDFCKYDMIHIDGGHGQEACSGDILNCRKFAGLHSFLVIDDSYLMGINQAINNHLDSNLIYEIDYSDYGLENTEQHRIFKYCVTI